MSKVVVAYNVVTGEITTITIKDRAVDPDPRLAPVERAIKITDALYNQFSSVAEIGAALPQTAQFYQK